jgi:hypothetical protein
MKKVVKIGDILGKMTGWPVLAGGKCVSTYD